ncbi:unnamed protein product [Amoebophrya sp. A25]|nr:unnamed protein product [Amoebophrya sp. A25]|eukprot:GSA25T00011589001.1
MLRRRRLSAARPSRTTAHQDQVEERPQRGRRHQGEFWQPGSSTTRSLRRWFLPGTTRDQNLAACFEGLSLRTRQY